MRLDRLIMEEAGRAIVVQIRRMPAKRCRIDSDAFLLSPEGHSSRTKIGPGGKLLQKEKSAASV